jgi:N-acetylmuramoyl-L-alanine amidase
MDHSTLAPFALRRSRIALLLAPVILLACFAGCSHRRSSMRPVYGTPVVGGSTVVTPVVPGGPVLTAPQTDEPILTPVPGSSSNSSGDGVNRAGGGSPPVAPEAEPPLNDLKPNDPGPATNPSGGINLNKPTAYQSTGRQASVPARNSRALLRASVAHYVSEPNDLFQPPKADRPWKYVVVHHSASEKGGLDQIDRDHRKVLGFEGCGYHFVIGNGTDSPDGQIEIADRWLSQKHGVHCRNGKTSDVNEYGIGICLVGNFDESAPTPKQVAAAKALVAYLSDRYQIGSDHLGSHDQFADGPTACPGKNFPSEAIFGSKHMAAR